MHLKIFYVSHLTVLTSEWFPGDLINHMPEIEVLHPGSVLNPLISQNVALHAMMFKNMFN